MLAELPLPFMAAAALLIAILMGAGLRRRNVPCFVGAACVLAVTVGFTLGASQ